MHVFTAVLYTPGAITITAAPAASTSGGQGLSVNGSASAVQAGSGTFLDVSGAFNAAASGLAVSPASAPAGTDVTAVFTARDASGNPVGSGGLPVTFTYSNNTYPASDNGDGTYSVVFPATASGTVLANVAPGTPAAANYSAAFTIAPATPAVSLSASPNPSASPTFGEPVTLSATVRPGGSSLPLVGSVTFLDNGAAIPGATNLPLVNGSAAFTASGLPVGTQTLTAVYGGDPNFAQTTSAPVTETVGPGAATVGVTAASHDAASGAPVTFTASVAPAGATGTVTFTDLAGQGTQPVGLPGASNLQLVNGSVTCTVAGLADGFHVITASYGGDANFSGTSQSFTLLVGSVSTTTAAPTVVSVTPQDAVGRGAAAGSSGGQRSVVSQLSVVFSAPVTLSAGAFTLGLVNSHGSGTNDPTGSTPNTDASSALGTPANPSGDGVTWVIPVAAGTTWSTALNGASGTGTATLNDGVYQLTAHAAAVAAAGGGPAMSADYAAPLFHRLYGDTDGNKTVNALDYAKFKNAFGSGSGQAAYNPSLDADGNGTINALDYAQFKKRFGTTFSY